jgi:RNA polymerase sigma factor (sigma-70 family)
VREAQVDASEPCREGPADSTAIVCNILGRSHDLKHVGDLAGERQPFEAVYRSSWLVLTRFAYLLVGDRSEAEDIVQSAFTSALARWDAIEEPTAYLRRAVINRASDVHRRSFRDAVPVVGASEVIDETDGDEVWTLVRALPTAQRAVVVLRFSEDLRLGDIAELLGRPASTVRSDLRRALTTLKGCLV